MTPSLRARSTPRCGPWMFTVIAVLLVGCSKTPEKLYPVSGTVSAGDRPLTGGTIQFEMMSKGESSGNVYTSSSEIDEQGRYTLSTFDKPGAPAGEHRVWVSPNFAAMPDKLGVSTQRMSADEFARALDTMLR